MPSLPASAQVGPYSETTSTPIPGAAHDYINGLNETVNPENGALSVRIQAPVPQERGLNLPLFAYVYDSNGQNVLVPNWAYSSFTNSEYVTSVNLQTPTNVGLPNTVTFDTSTINTFLGNRQPVSCTYWDNFIYTDSSGNRHDLTGLQGTSNTQFQGCQGIGINPSPVYEVGGDGIYNGIFLGPGANVQVFDNDGNLVSASAGTAGSGSGNAGPEDRNGNYLYASGRAIASTPSPMTIPSVGGPYASLNIPGLPAPYTFSASVKPRGATSPFPFNPTLLSSGNTGCPTSFGGTVGGYAGTANLTLPNSQQYTFTVDPVFGLLNHITYPTGATVDYTWATNSQSESARFYLPASTPQTPCFYNYDWPAIQTRILKLQGLATEEQDFTYTTVYGNGPSSEWTQKTTTVVTTDTSKSTHPSFKTIYTYNASDPSSGTPERDVIATYDIHGVLVKSDVKIIPDFYNNRLTSECISGPSAVIQSTFYSYYSNTTLSTDKVEYADGSGGSSCVPPTGTSPTRETVTAYHTFSPTPVSHTVSFIMDKPDSIKVYGSGTLAAETDFTYPDSTISVTPAATGHDQSNYSASFSTSRGNAGTVTKKCFVAGGSSCSDSISTLSYDETGQVVQSQDSLSNSTLYSYTDNYTTDNGSPSGNTNTYLTQLTRPSTNGVAHISSFQYGYQDGKLRLSTDENGMSTTYCYRIGGCSGSAFDPFLRLTQTMYPDGGQSSQAYMDTATGNTVTTSVSAAPDPDITTVSASDSLGRPSQDELTSDPDGTIYATTLYDGFGNVYQRTNPSRCSPGSACNESTAGVTTYNWDSIGRPTSVGYADGSSKTFAYGNTTRDRYDESGNHAQDTMDGFGRLVATKEPDPTSNNPALSTNYTYDALDNLTMVTQLGNPNAQPSDLVRTRTFVFDSLSRLLSASNPESGTVGYVYNTNGALTSRTDARGVTITYNSSSFPIDALGRVTQISYSDSTPSVTYTYDTTTQPNASNVIGRLTGETVQQGSTVLFQRLNTKYDQVGRLAQELQCLPSFCASYLADTDYTYNLAGKVSTSNFNETTHHYFYNGSGREFAMSYQFPDGEGAVLMDGVKYDPSGSITASGGVETRVYDQRERPTQITYSSTDLGMNYASAYDYYANGSVNHNQDYVIGNWTYGYDKLNRLTSASSQDPTVGSQTYTYDSFGNRLSQSGVLNKNATFSTATNRADCSGCYDASGNTLTDVNAVNPHSYTYDGEGRLSGVTDLGYQYLYDGEGRRIGVTQNGTIIRQYFRDALSQYYYVLDNNQQELAVEYFGAGRHIATVSDAFYLPLLDGIGTERSRAGEIGSSTNGFTENCGSLPFGDGLQCSNVDKSALHFTGKEKDSETGLDYFGARYYSSNMGRFMTPDPTGIASFNLYNPQSFDLYTYGLNNPLTNVDPDGTTCVQNTSDHGNTVDDGDGKGCEIVDNQNAQYAAQHMAAVTVYGDGTSADSSSQQVVNNGSASNNAGCRGQRIYSGVMGAANLGLAAYKGSQLGGAIAGIGANGVGAPAAAVLGVYGTVSIFGQGLAGASQLYSAFTGNYGTPSQVAQAGNILAGPVSGLGTLMKGGSVTSAESNAGYESLATAASSLIDSINAQLKGFMTGITDYHTGAAGAIAGNGSSFCGGSN